VADATDPQATATSENIVAFGPFRLLAAQRLLLEDDNPVRMGSRALDILTALVERPGELVGKDELMARVWRGTFVEEGNLKFQVGALRRALGDGRAGRRYIATSPGQGYRFVAPVSVAQAPAAASLPAAPTRQNHNLPQQLTRLIGRADAVGRIVARLQRHRLLSIVGPGGIGKTSVAIAAAEASVNTYEHGVWFVDLAPLADARLAPSAVATVLGFEIRSGDPVPGLVAALRDRRLLLVLDNCSHVIEAAANLAAAILRGAADVHILATSREPLRVEGEHVQRLPPLSSGSASDHPNTAEALAFPAVELFVERAAERLGEFELTDEYAPIVAEICLKLDGIPLAIELAAARVESFGVRGLAAHLDDRLRLLTGGRRSGPPRHRTLRAALDWSYDVLSEPERAVLRRLGIFMGGFTLDAACAVVADPGLLKSEVIDAVAELVEKSLAVVETRETEPRLRLLETTRAYALERLAVSGEREAVAHRRAEFYRDLFEKAETESEARPAAEWLIDYAQEIDNLRAALDWAFSPGGDGSIGVALTAAAVPLWMCLSLPEECRGRAERALDALGAGASRDARHEMKLRGAVGASLIYSRGAAGPEASMAYTRALEIAESLDDAEYRLRALWGLYTYHNVSGRYRVALKLAQRFHALAAERPDPNDRLTGEGMIGVAQHFLGDPPSAKRHLEHVLVAYVTPDRTSHIVRFQTDQRVVMRVFLARVLWLQGFSDQATRAAHSSVEEARAANHTISLCQALAHAACPLALLTGDLAAAEHYSTMLLDHSTRFVLAFWRAWGRSFQGVLVIQRGDVITGLQLLRAGFDEIGEAGFAIFRLIAILMAEALGRAGHITEGLAAIEEAILRAERTEERYTMAELMRVKGELLLLQGAPGAAAAAEDHFRQALDWARRQGALSWELRAARSLARLLRHQDRTAEAIAVLQPVYDRFTEGLGTADLVAAKQLMDDLASAGRD
jgi:predicted ATPase/DNA-binding winged helix-turn-helix (wHTH) protein